MSYTGGSAWQDALQQATAQSQGANRPPPSGTTYFNEGALSAPQASSYDKYLGAWQQAAPVLGGIQASAQQQINPLQEQLGLNDASYQEQSSFQNQMAGLQMKGLGLQTEALGNQQGTLAREKALAGTEFGYQQQLQGLTQQDIAAQKAQEQRSYETSLQSFLGGTAARGATSTVGAKTGWGNIEFQHKQAQESIGREQQRADIGAEQTQTQYNERLAQLADQGKSLDIASKSLGLSKETLTARVTHALQQLGISHALSAQQVFESIAQVQAGEFSSLASSGVLDMIDNIGQLGLGGSGGGSGPVPNVGQYLTPGMASQSGTGQQFSKNMPTGSVQPSPQNAVSLAQAFIGTPYSWGGTSSSGVDCSGLVQDIYKSMGVSLPRTTFDQAKQGQSISSLSDAQPGDLIFFTTEGQANNHVGIYIGNGKMIDSPHTGSYVQEQDVSSFAPISAIRRVLNGSGG